MTQSPTSRPAPPAPPPDDAGRWLSWALGAGVLLVALGYAAAGLLLRDPAPASALSPMAQMPVSIAPGSVAAGFTAEQFATPEAAARAEAILEQAGFLSQRKRLEATSAQQGGALEVALMWDSTSDVDLGVVEPDGALVDADHPTTAHGRIDVDANPTDLTRLGHARQEAGQVIGLDQIAVLPDAQFDGRRQDPPHPSLVGGRRKPQSLYTKKPIEHIYFDAPPPGTYAVTVRCWGWREAGRSPLPVVVEVRSRGQLVARVKGAVGPACYVSDRIEPTGVAKLIVR